MDSNNPLVVWYNKNIAAGWYMSTAMWVGIAAGLVEYLPDLAQKILDNFDVFTGVFSLSDASKRLVQAILLFVVLPMAKAWRQEAMLKASIRQSALLGKVVPLPASGVAPMGFPATPLDQTEGVAAVDTENDPQRPPTETHL